jgi:hypothetical protein
MSTTLAIALWLLLFGSIFVIWAVAKQRWGLFALGVAILGAIDLWIFKFH